MKLNDYSIFKVAEVLGIHVKGSRFTHTCPDCNGEPIVGESAYYAKLFDSNTYYCFKANCQKQWGTVTDLIMHHLGTDSLRDVCEWAKDHLDSEGDFEFEFSPICPYIQTLNELFVRSVATMQSLPEGHPVLQFMEQKYGFNKEDVQRYQLGYVGNQDLEGLSEEVCGGHKLHLLVGRVVIPYFFEGSVVALNGRFVGDTKQAKYMLVSNEDKYPLPLFNYYIAKKALSDKSKDTALLVCEGAMDSLAIHKFTGESASVAVSSASRTTLQQLSQLKELGAHCSNMVLCFDSDANNAGFEGATKLAKTLLLEGVDPHIYRLPLEDGEKKQDIGNYLRRAEHVALFSQQVVELVVQRPSFLISYMAENRQGISTKDSEFKKVAEWIVRQPERRREAYIKFLSTKPKDQNIDARYIIAKKHVEAEVIKAAKLLSRRSAEELKLAPKDMLRGLHYSAQDYWVDEETQLLHARKSVYTEITVEEDSKTLLKRVPVQIDVSTSTGGSQMVEFSLVDIGSLDERRASFCMLDDEDPERQLWSLDGNTPYCFRNFSGSKGVIDIDSQQLFLEVKSLFDGYVFFDKPYYSSLLAAYVMLTYVQMACEAVPYMHIHGKAGSGKSLICDLMFRICFNAEKMVLANAPHIYRSVHHSRGTLFLTEEDNLKGNTSERNNDLLPVLKDSYSKTGGFVKRYGQDKGNKYMATSFNAYGCKVFSGTQYIERILATRCININTAPVPKGYDGKLKNFQIDTHLLKSTFQELRNKLMVWSLTKYPFFMERYREGIRELLTEGVLNRDIDIWAPIYAIMSSCYACDDHKGYIVNIVDSLQKETQEKMAVSDAFECISVLYNMVQEYYESGNGNETGLHKYTFKDGTEKLIAKRRPFIFSMNNRIVTNNPATSYVNKNNWESDDKPRWLNMFRDKEYTLIETQMVRSGIKELGIKANNAVFVINESQLEDYMEAIRNAAKFGD